MADRPDSEILLCLAGDVMTGRGIDQILPNPGSPALHEGYVKDARDYVALAERASGPVPTSVDWAYVWGDALGEMQTRTPAVRLVNLETSVTRSDDVYADKRVHYRMSPANIGCLEAAGLDCCVLANNHVLDWGPQGLRDTLDALRDAGIRSVGAGLDRHAACAPAALALPTGRRVLVCATGFSSSGIPPDWAAGSATPGVCYVAEASARSADDVLRRLDAERRPGDLALVSLHWGGNWGYEIEDARIEFAHRLIDGGVDVVHGHSSHHPIGVEIYRERPVLYGCGDLLNDYEGIGGHEAYRPELVLLYWLRLDPATGALLELSATPFSLRRLSLVRADHDDVRWQARRLTHASRRFGVEFAPWDGDLVARWRR